MDHGAAQATLVEISFAVNTLGAVYEKLLDIISTAVKNSLAYNLGTVEALGGDKDNKPNPRAQQQLNTITEHLSISANSHTTLQEKSIPWMTFVSSIFAILCILVIYGGSVDVTKVGSWGCIDLLKNWLYFDWVEYLGPWALALMLPLPAFAILSYLNYLIFTIRTTWHCFGYKRYLKAEEKYNSPAKKYSPPTKLPAPILLKDRKDFPVTVILAVDFDFTNPDRLVPAGTEVVVLGLQDGNYAVIFEGQEYPISQGDLESSPVK